MKSISAPASETVTLDDLAQISPWATGVAIAQRPIDAHTAELLNQIHSETTERERRFLHNFMRDVWHGDGVVLEVGTYLGGTTRCLGLGMTGNQQGEFRKFVSCDRFEGYHDPKRLVEETRPLWENLKESQTVLAELREGRWYSLFRRCHEPSVYGEFLTIVEASLPDRPGEGETVTAIGDAVSEAGDLSVLFIDGCKSWYATKALLRTVIEKLQPGGWVIAQDFLRYTCFWLPVFFDTFRDHFTRFASVSGTVTFRYNGGLTSQEIANRFPDTPAEMTVPRLNDCFARQSALNLTTGDPNGLIVSSVQQAGAIAYVGETETARSVLQAAKSLPALKNYGKVFDEALVAPTFSPDTPIYLGEDPGAETDSGASCNICGCRDFLPGFKGRLTNGLPPQCVSCKAVERHRAVHLVYSFLRHLLKDWRVLQFAPDRSISPDWCGSFQPSIYGTASSLDMMDTGLPAGSFDLLVSNHVLEHVPDDVKAMQEQLRLVGDTGVVHVCVPSPTYVWETSDWGFADPTKNEHYRDYGSDFPMNMVKKLDDCHAIAASIVDPVTSEPDLVYWFSRSNVRLSEIAHALQRNRVPLTRIH
jgi:SAM-dependent methyltransferase/predicted O-methyltransferase YrrM